MQPSISKVSKKSMALRERLATLLMMIFRQHIHIYAIVTLVCVTLAYIALVQVRVNYYVEPKNINEITIKYNISVDIKNDTNVHRILYENHRMLVSLMDYDLDLKKDVILPMQQLPPIEHQSRESDKNLGRPVNYVNYRKFRRLLGFMVNVMERYNITYILSDGTLLGSYLYHDMLPWDDDIDIRVAYRDYAKLKKVVYQDPVIRGHVAFHSWGDPEKGVDEFDDAHINKIYDDVYESKSRLHRHKWNFKNEKKTFNYAWRWPFLDIMFMKENSTHVWTLENRPMYFKLNEYYPLHVRPFMGMWLPTPHDSRLYLKKKYNTFKCKSHFWNHVSESGKAVADKECSTFNDIYPRVIRTKHKNGTLEQLTLTESILYSAYVHEPFTGKVAELSVD